MRLGQRLSKRLAGVRDAATAAVRPSSAVEKELTPLQAP
jgi:hypothetical protein